MSIAKRIHRLFKADLNYVIESLEDPLSNLKLSLQEMEEVLISLESQFHSLSEKLKCKERTKRDLEKRLFLQIENLKLCFEQNDEALIKRQVRKKLELEKMLKSEIEEIDVLKIEITDIEEVLQSKREKYETLKTIEYNEGIPIKTENEQSLFQISQDEVDLEYIRMRSELTKKQKENV